MAPLLFNLYICDIIKKYDKNITDYADDIVIFHTCIDELSKILVSITNDLRNIGLIVNNVKSKSAIFNHGYTEQNIKLLH